LLLVSLASQRKYCYLLGVKRDEAKLIKITGGPGIIYRAFDASGNALPKKRTRARDLEKMFHEEIEIRRASEPTWGKTFTELTPEERTAVVRACMALLH